MNSHPNPDSTPSTGAEIQSAAAPSTGAASHPDQRLNPAADPSVVIPSVNQSVLPPLPLLCYLVNDFIGPEWWAGGSGFDSSSDLIF